MTIEQAMEEGKRHARNNKKLTPYDCRDFDAQLFVLMRGKELSAQNKIYISMRGAFNKAWDAEYYKMVTE